MLLLRQAVSRLQPAASSSPAAATRLLSSTAATSSSSSSDYGKRGRTAGELGDDAAQSMQGAEGKAAGAGDKVEPKVFDSGFVPSTDGAVPSPDAAGRVGGIGSDIMGDMVDMVGAAVSGDDKRAAADVADMARHQASDANTSTHAKPPHTTTQDWPRGSITDPTQASTHASQPGADPSGVGEAPFVNTDEAHAAGIDRYEGTIPRVDPSEELPEVDQDPLTASQQGPRLGMRPGEVTRVLSEEGHSLLIIIMMGPGASIPQCGRQFVAMPSVPSLCLQWQPVERWPGLIGPVIKAGSQQS